MTIASQSVAPLFKLLGALFIIAAFLVVSGLDREIQQNENNHWCDMVASGTWYASQDEYAVRCEDNAGPVR